MRNQQGYAHIIATITIVAIALLMVGVAWYYDANREETATNVAVKSTSVVNTNAPANTNTTVNTNADTTDYQDLTVSLGEEFDLHREQTATLGGTEFSVAITEFYNQPCLEGAICIWSGIGIRFQYTLGDQQIEQLDLVRAFGYLITVLQSDYESTARLTITEDENATTNTNTSATTGWETYANETQGYAMQYPPAWSIDETRSTETEIVFAYGVADSREAISAEVSAQSLDDWRENVDDAVVLNEDEFTVAGEDALRVDTSEFRQTYIVFRHGAYFYTITTTGGRMVDDGVLGTFRFTDSTTTTSSALNTYSTATVAIGDTVAGMTVTDIQPGLGTEVAPDNIWVTFDGEAQVTGTYVYYDEGIINGQVCVNDLDTTSLSLLPTAQERTQDIWFCFTEREAAQELLGPAGSTGPITVTIDDYMDQIMGTTAFNTASLVEL